MLGFTCHFQNFHININKHLSYHHVYNSRRVTQRCLPKPREPFKRDTVDLAPELKEQARFLVSWSLTRSCLVHRGRNSSCWWFTPMAQKKKQGYTEVRGESLDMSGLDGNSATNRAIPDSLEVAEKHPLEERNNMMLHLWIEPKSSSSAVAGEI